MNISRVCIKRPVPTRPSAWGIVGGIVEGGGDAVRHSIFLGLGNIGKVHHMYCVFVVHRATSPFCAGTFVRLCKRNNPLGHVPSCKITYIPTLERVHVPDVFVLFESPSPQWPHSPTLVSVLGFLRERRHDSLPKKVHSLICHTTFHPLNNRSPIEQPKEKEKKKEKSLIVIIIQTREGKTVTAHTKHQAESERERERKRE